ncbi:anaerobic ribonucleoside-triphosphate reductase [Sansalvadorimonas sp. 2012CJ34-2]|uniref:Anaerobic ribonucleoside-triphosphate reductase n=1 Tax=Parendozoicomonas callyspongiae TaxID=2942213 RepID=A0ABT0PKP6_9GAMM|nr:anaerobic ribonucleoside-triphosphate reductase [Sansalvadorimonas sp. 2012CJ34-2]MCL6271556.1 anaerobic ribonucleoside-triphosphate reductase [Sansalvadorimonas sp. 2012CJ34-2]
MQPNQQTIHLDDSERQPCEVWTRVMGYHRPVAAFNPGKQQEQKDRKHFIERTANHRE